MRALASQSGDHATPLKKRPPVPVSPPIPQIASFYSSVIQRKAGCACGGDCPSCAEDDRARKIQTKLQVSAPGDQFEQEADRVADQVMRMPAPTVQRQCNGCSDASTRPSDDDAPRIQRQTNSESGAREVTSDFTSQLGVGSPLDTASRRYFEPRFGHDFGNVRIHSGPQAATAADRVKARAFTLGQDVVFAAGEHDPGSESGKRLLAHELTHVIQQSGSGRAHIGPKMDRVAEGTGRGLVSPVRTLSQSAQVQRVCGSAAIGNPAGCEPFGSVATEQIFSVPTERFLFTVNCNDFASAAERTRLRALAPTIPAADPVDIHGFASEEGDVTYNARLSCSRAHRVRDELVAARTHAGLPALNLRRIYNHGATAFGTRDVDRSVVIPLARPPTLEILPAGFIGPPAANQRRAAASCSIDCGDQNLGTLNAMGLHFHRSLAILPSGDPTANGVGTSLHFTETNIEIPDTDACHCDDYRMIQVITTTHPAAGRVSPYVDNNGVATPFYDAVFAHGEGIHDIPFFLPDAGERVQSTISMYDAPSRPTAGHAGEDIRWNAEACVACIKNADPDRILGCATYGFSIPWNAGAGAHDPAVGIGPGCRAAPSAGFLDSLRTDPTVAAFDFEGR
jgi:outer membrane protein OmpA-like peptidoglycan-associated protein